MNIQKKNIIYFLPAAKNPSGGAKYMYQHSNLINKMNIKGLSSSIIHYKKKKFLNLYTHLSGNILITILIKTMDITPVK